LRKLPIQVQKLIELGLEQSDKGFVYTHEKVMTKIKYPFINII